MGYYNFKYCYFSLGESHDVMTALKEIKEKDMNKTHQYKTILFPCIKNKSKLHLKGTRLQQNNITALVYELGWIVYFYLVPVIIQIYIQS